MLDAFYDQIVQDLELKAVPLKNGNQVLPINFHAGKKVIKSKWQKMNRPV